MVEIQKIIKDAESSPEYWAEAAKLDFACLLNEKMMAQKISRTKLAEKIGVSKSYIAEVLGGEVADFTIDEMSKFMFAFGEHMCLTSEPIQDSHIDVESIYSSSKNVVFEQPDYAKIADIKIINKNLSENYLSLVEGIAA